MLPEDVPMLLVNVFVLAAFKQCFAWTLHCVGQVYNMKAKRPAEFAWACLGQAYNMKAKRPAVAHVNPHQRSLPTTQAHYPTTEDTAGFCLLCCQPEPVPLSLSTRTSQLTLCCPCGVPTWSGRAINAARRT